MSEIDDLLLSLTDEQKTKLLKLLAKEDKATKVAKNDRKSKSIVGDRPIQVIADDPDEDQKIKKVSKKIVSKTRSGSRNSPIGDVFCSKCKSSFRMSVNKPDVKYDQRIKKYTFICNDCLIGS
jgi:hypothetical protein